MDLILVKDCRCVDQVWYFQDRNVLMVFLSDQH